MLGGGGVGMVGGSVRKVGMVGWVAYVGRFV